MAYFWALSLTPSLGIMVKFFNKKTLLDMSISRFVKGGF
jgi:hypothetical protein